VRVRWYIPYLFILPVLVGLSAFKLYPILLAVTTSFYTRSFSLGVMEFVGLANFIDLFSDTFFLDALKVTLKFNLLVNPIQVVMAILLAVLANQALHGINGFRTLFYIPAAVAVPIASVMWGLLLNPNNGFVNSLLALIGIPAQPFLVDENQALYSIILIASWIGISYWMIFILAALQELPPQISEAARIDGASPIQNFFHITLPMLKRAIAFIAVGATTSNFLLFAPVYILTGGGPSGSTNLLMNEAYVTAFLYSDMGRANAIVVVLLAIVIMAVFLLLRILRPTDV
jgi:multiple sugar transport system permease protein